jgi:ketosteroid isomerase-like protein
MHRPYRLAVWCTTILLVAATTGARAQSDPQALLQQQFETIARGDVVGALALYTDDAVVDGVGLCAAAPCVGKAAIQKEFENRIAHKVHTTALNYYVSGNVATTRYAVHSDSTQQAGVDRIIGWDIVEIKQGKIATARGPLWERTDAQTARYLEWQRAQQATR